MGTDLNKIIKNHELDDHQIMFLTYQILRGLKYLHTSNIIHRVGFYRILLKKKYKFFKISTKGSETK